jgi:hypothetical protein
MAGSSRGKLFGNNHLAAVLDNWNPRVVDEWRAGGRSERPRRSPGTRSALNQATNLHADAGVRVSMFRPRFR